MYVGLDQDFPVPLNSNNEKYICHRGNYVICFKDIYIYYLYPCIIISILYFDKYSSIGLQDYPVAYKSLLHMLYVENAALVMEKQFEDVVSVILIEPTSLNVILPCSAITQLMKFGPIIRM